MLGIIGFIVTEQLVFALLWGWDYLYLKKYLYYVIALLTGIVLQFSVFALALFAVFGANRLLALPLLITGFAALGTAVWTMAVHAWRLASVPAEDDRGCAPAVVDAAQARATEQRLLASYLQQFGQPPRRSLAELRCVVEAAGWAPEAIGPAFWNGLQSAWLEGTAGAVPFASAGTNARYAELLASQNGQPAGEDSA